MYIILDFVYYYITGSWLWILGEDCALSALRLLFFVYYRSSSTHVPVRPVDGILQMLCSSYPRTLAILYIPLRLQNFVPSFFIQDHNFFVFSSFMSMFLLFKWNTILYVSALHRIIKICHQAHAYVFGGQTHTLVDQDNLVQNIDGSCCKLY